MASVFAASSALADFNNRMSRQRIGMGLPLPPQKIPYQNYLPTEDELRIQREHVQKYLPSNSDVVNDINSHSNQNTIPNGGSSIELHMDDNNLPNAPNGLALSFTPNNLPATSNTAIPHHQLPPHTQLPPTSLPPTFYLSPFGASPFITNSYPSPPQHFGLPMGPMQPHHHNNPFAQHLPPHLLQFPPPGSLPIGLGVGLGQHGLPPPLPLPQHLNNPSPMKKPSKKTAPTPVDQELLARQLVLLANQTPPPGPPSPTKSVDGDGAPVKKHRGFGASAQMFNADGSIEVGGKFEAFLDC